MQWAAVREFGDESERGRRHFVIGQFGNYGIFYAGQSEAIPEMVTWEELFRESYTVL
jgi:hypothetical protein